MPHPAQIRDGEIQAHLSTIVVASSKRHRGLGRALLAAAFEQAGGLRIDLVSVSDQFYERLGARRLPGFRLSPVHLLSH